MIQTNTEQYKKNYIAFHEAVKQYIAKNGRQSITKEVLKSILQQAQTKFGLQVRNGVIVQPTKKIQRPAPQARQAKPTAKAQSRPMKPFWMP